MKIISSQSTIENVNISSNTPLVLPMTDHVIIDKITSVYQCENCGFKSEPPWMTPSEDVVAAAIDCFYEEHSDCVKINASPLQLPLIAVNSTKLITLLNHRVQPTAQ